MSQIIYGERKWYLIFQPSARHYHKKQLSFCQYHYELVVLYAVLGTRIQGEQSMIVWKQMSPWPRTQLFTQSLLHCPCLQPRGPECLLPHLPAPASSTGIFFFSSGLICYLFLPISRQSTSIGALLAKGVSVKDFLFLFAAYRLRPEIFSCPLRSSLIWS